MTHYLFKEGLTGKEFFVSADCIGKAAWIADSIAQDIGKEYNEGDYLLNFIDELTDDKRWKSEISELDIY